MTTGGESPNPYAIRIEIKFASMAANPAKCARCISQFDGMVIAGAETVFQHEGRDAEIVEPARDLHTFVVCCQHGISTARNNQHSSVGFAPGYLGSGVERQSRLIFRSSSERSWCAIWPEQHGLRRSGWLSDKS